MSTSLIFEQAKRQLNNSPYVLDAVQGLQYDVPCMRGQSGEFWPVIPLIHDDLEIGFPHIHVHFDFRFFYEFELRWFREETLGGPREKFSYIKLLKRQGGGERPDDFPLEVRIESRYCRRNNGIPHDRLCGFVKEGIENFLQDEEKNKKHLEAGVCPHKGHKFASDSIRGCKGHEILHCPLHGLKFQMKTGKLLHCQKPIDKTAKIN